MNALRAVEEAAVGRHERRRRIPGLLGRAPPVLQRRHVDGMLQHGRDLPGGVEHGNVGDAPIALGKSAALRFGAGHVEAQQGHGVRLPRADHALERGDHLPDRFGVARECVPGPAPDDVGQLALHAGKVGAVRADDVELAVEHEVRVGRGLEQALEVQLRHAEPISGFGSRDPAFTSPGILAACSLVVGMAGQGIGQGDMARVVRVHGCGFNTVR